MLCLSSATICAACLSQPKRGMCDLVMSVVKKKKNTGTSFLSVKRALNRLQGVPLCGTCLTYQGLWVETVNLERTVSDLPR